MRVRTTAFGSPQSQWNQKDQDIVQIMGEIERAESALEKEGNTLSSRIRAMTNVLREELVLAVRQMNTDNVKGGS